MSMASKGFQASTNFLIVIIIGIVVVGLGIGFFSTIFEQSEDLTGPVGDQQRRQLDQKLDDGSPITVLRPSKTIQVGQSAIFYLGITNVNTTERTIDHLSVEPVVLVSPFDSDQLSYDEQEFTINPGERSYKKILVSVPQGAASQTHIINVTACLDTSCNQHLHHPVRLFVNVP